MAPVRKYIPQVTGQVDAGLCGTESHHQCALYRRAGEASSGDVCPLLGQSVMQHCGAAPVRKLIPYTEPALSRCGSSAHLYCDLYLELTDPGAGRSEGELKIPEGLLYTSNHMWVHQLDDGLCYAGVDAFLARLLGAVQHVDFSTASRDGRPMAVLTTGQVEAPVRFPARLEHAVVNQHLRADPMRVVNEPYTRGWLFEGQLDPNHASFLTAKQAQGRLDEDVHRLHEWIQGKEGGTATDGGLFEAGLLMKLDHAESLRLYMEFCPQGWGWDGGSR